MRTAACAVDDADTSDHLWTVAPAGPAGSDRRRRPGTGEQVRGTVVFDLTRQRATLVLSDDLRSVTAIAIAG